MPAPSGTETMAMDGVTTTISTKHQSITAMEAYESQSLEELRLEDYQANRKGPQNPVGAATGTSLFGASTARSSASTGLFGATPSSSSFSFGNKNAFGQGTNTFGTNTGSLFGQAAAQPASSLFNKPFPSTTTQNAGFSFGNTNTLGQPQTSTTGLFGSTQATQSTGLFGTATNTNAGSAFGTGTNLFGQTSNTPFGGVGNSTLFNNQPTAFGTTTTSAPAFGTDSGTLFCKEVILRFGWWRSSRGGYINATRGLVIFATSLLIFGMIFSCLTFLKFHVGRITASLGSAVLESFSAMFLLVGMSVYTAETSNVVLNSSCNYQWSFYLCWTANVLLIISERVIVS